MYKFQASNFNQVVFFQFTYQIWRNSVKKTLKRPFLVKIPFWDLYHMFTLAVLLSILKTLFNFCIFV